MAGFSAEMRSSVEAVLTNSEVLERVLRDQSLALYEMSMAASRDGWVDQVANARSLAQATDSQAQSIRGMRDALTRLLRIESGGKRAAN